MTTKDLKTLATLHGTDKWNTHWYAEHYDRHFSPWRAKPIRLLEIGIGGYAESSAGGQSLRMWKEFFPQGQIVGLDIHDKSSHNEDRIRTYQGSQTDKKILQRMVDECGPFDLIVDDGSHRSEHVIATFEFLFERGLVDGGIYAVEDLQTSYWGGFGGSGRLDSTRTSMAYLKRLCDGLNHRDWHRPGYRATYLNLHVSAVHFYPSLAFVQKGDNSRESNLVKQNRAPLQLRNAVLGAVDHRARSLVKAALATTPQGQRLLRAIQDRNRSNRSPAG